MAALALFFVSGFSALVYELLWFRHLGFIFGNTVYAATTVVTAYMLGLALGAQLMGRWATRIRAPIRAFGLLEAGIGLYALAMPWLFEVVRWTYRLAYQQVTDSLPVLTPLRFALALLVLILPTMLMGATLPILSHALIGRTAQFGRRLSWLYGVNTLGAVAGILSAGFLLIPQLGLRGANFVAVAGNLAIGLAAVALSRRFRAPEVSPSPSVAASPGAAPERVRAVYAGVLVSGFIALALEVVWFRALVLVFGSTTYSFCAMLSMFLFGIGAGSLLLGWLADRARYRLLWLAAAQFGIGAFTLISMPWFNAMPEHLLRALVRFGFEWRTLVTSQFLITLCFLLVPTLLMGLTFTLASAIARSAGSTAASAVGRVYAANTVGCVFGSLAGGFLLLPALGIERSLWALALAALALGALLALAAAGTRAGRGAVVALAAAALSAGVLWPPHWNRQLMSAGPYFSSWSFVNGSEIVLWQRIASEDLALYREGVTATASVTKTDDENLYFSMDGKVEADTTPRGMVVQRMIGHLPMLFHPNPRSAMNLGLGAGVTFGSLGCYPLDHLEVVEIEPAAVEVARVWSNYNHGIVFRPDARITINDGRNHFFCSTNRYDVITSDPFEPVVGGASHLFTVEHFRLARGRLAPGGIMCQWVPMYEMTARDFLTILRSFVHVFPRSALFFTGLDVVMLGFEDQVALDPANVRAKYDIPAVSNSLAEVGFSHAEMILGMFVADMSKGRGFVGEGPLNTDGRPVIEFSAPKSQVKFTAERNQEILLENFTDIPDELLAGFSDESVDEIRAEHEALRLALLSSMQRAAGQMESGYQTLMQAYEMAPENPVIRNELAAVMMSSAVALKAAQNLTEAANQYQMALQVNPREFWALHDLVGLGVMAGNNDFARHILDMGLATYPDSPLIRVQSAKFWFSLGRWDEALSEMRVALELNPRKARVWDDYAQILDQMGQSDLAQSARDKAARLRADLRAGRLY